MNKNIFGSSRPKEKNNPWVSVSDLMSILMMVFMLIAISFMLQTESSQKRVSNVVKNYQNTKQVIYEQLYQEFNRDFKKWNMEIEKETLTVRFKSPDVLFNTGSYQLSNKFKKILASFIPRYINILYKNSKAVQEIRIEGFTDSWWRHNVSKKQAYINNMSLSQRRTMSILRYILNLNINQHYQWIRNNITATGFSSSHLLRNSHGQELHKYSRRVEFRTILNTEKNMVQIMKELKNNGFI